MTNGAIYSTDGPRVYPDEGDGDGPVADLIDSLSSTPPWANVYYAGEDGFVLHRFQALNERIIDRFDNYYLQTPLGPDEVTDEGIPGLTDRLDGLWDDGWEMPDDDGGPTHPNRLQELGSLPEPTVQVDAALESLLAAEEPLRWTVPDLAAGYRLLGQILRADPTTTVVIAEDVDHLSDVAHVCIELGETDAVVASEQTEERLGARRSEAQEERLDAKYDEVEEAVLSLRESTDPQTAAFDEFEGFLVILEYLQTRYGTEMDAEAESTSQAILEHDLVRTCRGAAEVAESFETVDAAAFHDRIASLAATQQRQAIAAYLEAIPSEPSDPDETLSHLERLEAEFVGEPDGFSLVPDFGDSATSWAAIADEIEAVKARCRSAVVVQEADRLDDEIAAKADRLAARDAYSETQAQRALLARSERATVGSLLRAYVTTAPRKTAVAMVVIAVLLVGFAVTAVLIATNAPI